MHKATKEEMKAEAIRRMEKLELDGHLISEFKSEDHIFFSENLGEPFNAIWYSLSKINNHTETYTKFWELITELKEKYGCMAFHGQLTHTKDMGDCFTLLYVSPHKDEWEDENDALEYVPDPMRRGHKCCYPMVYSKAGPYAEFGSAKIRPSMGGIVRA